MTILLTGSAGKTASALADALSPDHNILVASRRPNTSSKHPTVQFDWLDDTTWSNVFSHSLIQVAPIHSVYLVLPDLSEARANALAFIQQCMSNGVRRFVLLSAWENPEGGALLGGVHAALKALGQDEGIEWAVLRPHFFMGEQHRCEVVNKRLTPAKRTSPSPTIWIRSRKKARSTPALAREESRLLPRKISLLSLSGLYWILSP